MAEVVEAFKDLSGTVSSVLVLADARYSILPLNPGIHEHLWPVAAALAVVAGFGAHRFAKNSGRLILGWIFLALAFFVLIAILLLVVAPSRDTVSLGAKIAYVSFFVFLGGAAGGFWGGDEQVSAADRSEPKL
jgi:hypothetical protein